MNLEGIKTEYILKEIQELMNHDILIPGIFPYSFYKGNYKIDFRDLKLHDIFMIRVEVDTFKLVFKCFAGIKIFDLASNLVVDGDLFEVIEAPKLTRENEFYEFKFKVVGNDSEFNVLHFSELKKKKIENLPVSNNPPIVRDEVNSVYYMDSVMKDISQLSLEEFVKKYHPFFGNWGGNNRGKDYRNCLRNAVLLKKRASLHVSYSLVDLRMNVKNLKILFPELKCLSNGTLKNYMMGYGFMTIETLNKIKKITGIEFYDPEDYYILKK